MADPFVAEIRMFAFNFAPTGWAQCNGQLLPISQNTALFSLLGTMYGGDGKSTFALPNLNGSVPLHRGQGPGLSEYLQGEIGGVQAVTLLQSEIPAHSHSLNAATVAGDTDDPTGALLSTGVWRSDTGRGAVQIYSTQAPDAGMRPDAIGIAGSSLPHNNMMPSLVVNFCIALQGVYPPRQ